MNRDKSAKFFKIFFRVRILNFAWFWSQAGRIGKCFGITQVFNIMAGFQGTRENILKKATVISWVEIKNVVQNSR